MADVPSLVTSSQEEIQRPFLYFVEFLMGCLEQLASVFAF